MIDAVKKPEKSAAGRVCAGFLVLLLCAAGAVAIAGEQTRKQPFVASGNKLFMVFANYVEGQEPLFNEWYDRHVQAVVKLPGFVRVQRFKMQPREGRPDPKFRYLIIYEVQGDPSAVHVKIAEAVKAGKVESPDKRAVLEYEAMIYGPVTQVW